MAASSAVANTLFISTKSLATLGLGAAAVMPIGWVVAAATVSGSAYYGVTQTISRYAGSKVEVIPKFINSPIDQLGAALLDMMGALSLKVPQMDTSVDPLQRTAMVHYFVAELGYDQTYAERAIETLEGSVFDRPIKIMTSATAKFVRDCPDCNFLACQSELMVLLREVADADGRVDEREELAVDAIGAAIRK